MHGSQTHHSHSSCCHAHSVMPAQDTLAKAEDYCRRNALRMTPQRRAVLETLATACTPLGAYDVIEVMRKEGKRAPAPIVIYRVLDFLKEHGFIHRLETLNAFIACPHRHDASTRVIFFICEACRQVEEVVSAPVDAALLALARARQFAPARQVMEMAGICQACSKSSTAAATEPHPLFEPLTYKP